MTGKMGGKLLPFWRQMEPQDHFEPNKYKTVLLMVSEVNKSMTDSFLNDFLNLFSVQPLGSGFDCCACREDFLKSGFTMSDSPEQEIHFSAYLIKRLFSA